MNKSKKPVRFRVTEVTDYEVDLGDIPPAMFLAIMQKQSDHGFVTEDSWHWQDITKYQEVSYDVEIVEDETD